jgi:hypothetical protein
MEVWGEEKIPWPLAIWESFLDKLDIISKRKFYLLLV